MPKAKTQILASFLRFCEIMVANISQLEENPNKKLFWEKFW
jgi:hypothetical protein